MNKYLGQKISIIIDRLLGTNHPKHGYKYELNYGYLPDTVAPDGEEIDAYIIDLDQPVEEATGTCIAIIHRLNDNDDKLVISTSNKNVSNDEINKLTNFQEKFFKHEIIR